MSLDDSRKLPEDFAAKERQGWAVAAGLLLLTLIEYFVTVSFDDPLLWLLPFVLAKGLLILEYFMHFTGLFNSEEH